MLRNPPLSHNLGMIPPSPDRQPVFPVLPRLFGAGSGIRTRPLIDRSNITPTIGLYGNDTRSNCSSVAVANGINAISALTYPDRPEERPVISENNVMRFYSQSTGYDPTKPDTDRGANPDSVAKFLQVHGYPTTPMQYFPLVGEMDVTDMQSLRTGLDAFGVINVGVGLSVNDHKNELWDIGDTPDDVAGGWGWHLLNFWDYDGIGDTDSVTLLTFGGYKYATWRWMRERAVIAHGCSYIQLTTNAGESFDHQKWNDYLLACRQCSHAIS